MCGICGIINSPLSKEKQVSITKKMMNKLIHCKLDNPETI